jgi:aminomethyltransferase
MLDTCCSPSRYRQTVLFHPHRVECTGQLLSSFRGATATQFLEWLTPSSLSTLAPYSSTLSVLLNEHGGIIDDTVITKHASDAFYVVTNAGRRAEDLAWFKARLTEWNVSERAKDGPVEHEVLDGWGLLALQGVSSI